MATTSDNRSSSLAATPPADYPIARHRTHSKELMKAARELIGESKRVRGSNAAWGAMAHALKSIGRERGMTYNRHKNASNLVTDLTRGDASPEAQAIVAGFNTAEVLHTNFYNDRRNKDRLTQDLDMVERAIDLLFERHDRWKRQNPHRNPLQYSVGASRQPDLARSEVNRQLRQGQTSKAPKPRKRNPLGRRRF